MVLHFLNLKSFHPSNKQNQRRKWIAEQNHKDKKRKEQERARQYEEEQETYKHVLMAEQQKKVNMKNIEETRRRKQKLINLQNNTSEPTTSSHFSPEQFNSSSSPRLSQQPQDIYSTRDTNTFTAGKPSSKRRRRSKNKKNKQSASSQKDRLQNSNLLEIIQKDDVSFVGDLASGKSSRKDEPFSVDTPLQTNLSFFYNAPPGMNPNNIHSESPLDVSAEGEQQQQNPSKSSPPTTSSPEHVQAETHSSLNPTPQTELPKEEHFPKDAGSTQMHHVNTNEQEEQGEQQQERSPSRKQGNSSELGEEFNMLNRDMNEQVFPQPLLYSTMATVNSSDSKKNPKEMSMVEKFPFLKNAPVAGAYTENAKVSHQPFGVELRNVKCMRCGAFGHTSGDRECPLFDYNPLDAQRQLAEDPVSFMNNALSDDDDEEEEHNTTDMKHKNSKDKHKKRKHKYKKIQKKIYDTRYMEELSKKEREALISKYKKLKKKLKKESKKRKREERSISPDRRKRRK